MELVQKVYPLLASLYHKRKLARLRRTYGYKNQFSYELKCGYTMALRWDDHIAQRLLLTDRFESEVSTAMFALVRPGMTVIDIGANIGVHTLHLSKLVGETGRVLAFEPNLAVNRQLQENIARNHINNVSVFDVALWDSDSTEFFYFPEKGLEAFGGLRSNSRFKVEYKAQVETATLDTVLTKLGIRLVDFIKIDVEGAELPVLRGAESILSSSTPPALLYETVLINTRPYSYTPEELHAFITGKNYMIEMIDQADYLALPSITKGSI